MVNAAPWTSPWLPPGSGLLTWGDLLCRVRGFDLVAQDEAGAGITGAGGGELVAEPGEGLRAAGRAKRVEPDEQLAVTGADITGGGECLADQCVCLVAGAGVVAVQGAGQGGFGVVGGHPDGVGDLLGLGVQADHVRGQGAERDPGRDGRRGLVRFPELAPGGFHGGIQGVDHLVAQVGGLAGGGAAQSDTPEIADQPATTIPAPGSMSGALNSGPAMR